MKHPQGFIALITAVIISTILLGLATTIGASTFYSRFNALNGEFKRVSLSLAESCVNAALLKIGNNYNYLVTTDPAYNAARGGVVIPVGGGDCVIKSPTALPPEVAGKRTFPIVVQGQYRGAFSNLAVSGIAQNPAVAPVTPPPTCSLVVSPTSAPQGSQIVLAWSTSANATSFTLDHGIGSVSPVSTGNVNTTASGVGSITYVGTAQNAGGNGTCTATVTVLPPPPAPSCADTVMILDRTGSMGSTDLSNERNAANALVDLYATVVPSPKVGVGSFGGLDGSAASVPLNGQLSSAFSTIKNTINQITSTNSSVGSDLSAAITVGAAELNTIRHTDFKQKVLVLVSDGIPNQPSNFSGDTGWKSPVSNIQNGSGDQWGSANNAYSDGSGDASDPVSENDRHRFYDFNFPTLSGSVSITDIDIALDAWATDSGGGTATTLLTDGFGTGSTDTSFNEAPVWTENGSSPEKRASGTGNDTASPDGGRFAAMNSGDSICEQVDAAGVGSMQLSYYWRGDSDAESSDAGVVEYRTGGSCTSNNGWTTLSSHILTNTSWSSLQTISLPSSINNSTFYVRFRANSNSSNEDFRFDGVRIAGTTLPGTSCQIGVDLSWDGGSNWTSERTQTVTGTEATYTLGGDTWSRTWSAPQFTNANFRVRVRAIDPGSACGNSAILRLDWVRARVSYTQNTDPAQAGLDAATAAKTPAGTDNLPVTIVGIYFDTSGGSSGQNYLNSLTTQNVVSIPATTLARSSNVVTVTTPTVHQLVKGQRVTITGASNSGYNGTFIITSVPTANTFRYSQTGTNGSASNGTITVNKNFFVSPGSADMQAVFQAIGAAVCPASAAQCANTSDDDGDGQVDASDPDCHTDSNAGNAGSYDATDNDEWGPLVIPTPPPPPPPPPTIKVGSWVETPTAP